MHLLTKILKYISLPAATLAGVMLTALHTANHITYAIFEGSEVAPLNLWYSFLASVIYIGLAIFLYFLFERDEKFEVVATLWRLFGVGAMALFIILILILASKYIENHTNMSEYVQPIAYSVSLYLTLIVFYWTIFTFRRLILYQRNRAKVIKWNIFMVLLVLGLIFTINPFNLHPTSSNTSVFLIVVAVYSVYLSTDIGWTTHLNFNQKLRTLGIFGFLILMNISFLVLTGQYVGIFNFYYRNDPHDLYFTIGFFSLIYSLFSVIVLFLNLPAASVYEARTSILDINSRISQSLTSKLKQEDILKSLLDGAILSADADAGWIEWIENEDKTMSVNIPISRTFKPQEVKKILPDNDLMHLVLLEKKHHLVPQLHRHAKLGHRISDKYRSLLTVPIYFDTHNYGAITLLKEYTNAFEDATIRLVTTLAEQTGAAIHQVSIIQNAIELERYHEVLKIAQQVQTQLFPRILPKSSYLDMAVWNQNADEVGGDYYDAVAKDEHIFRIAVGDVSGKGTTAAFYMATLKGIFQALSSLDLSTQEVIGHINNALGRILQRGLFITLTYVEIDVSKQTFSLVRAGHCPSFLYEKDTHQIQVLREGVPAFGFFRDAYGYKLHNNNVCERSYVKGDMLVLFTDGIIEAKNPDKEEFGYDRLKEIIMNNIEDCASDLSEKIGNAVKVFTGKDAWDDDSTVFVIRFT